MVLLGFVFVASWDCQSKHPLYSNAGHLTRWDGLADRKRKISTEYGIEHPRVDGSIPSQATKQEPFPRKEAAVFSYLLLSRCSMASRERSSQPAKGGHKSMQLPTVSSGTFE